jgi:tetratricopeptide (TPR) repeat protein
LVVQQRGGTVTSIEEIPPGVRIANAFVSYFIYLEKTFWPHDLAVFYPHPHGSPPLWQVLGAVLLLGAATFAIITAGKRAPYLAVGWLWFTGTLVPVIGIVQVGGQAMADRYAYIPLIGIFVMAAWGVPELLRKWQSARPLKMALSASAAVVLVSLSMVTWKQVGYWNDSIALYDHTLEVTTDNDIIYYNRALVYKNTGNLRQAIADFDSAIQINPEDPEAYNNRGLVYDKLGDPVWAIADFDRAIQINPRNSKAYNNRGVVYGKLGNNGRAIWNYDRAIEMRPGYAMAFVNRGLAYGRLGDLKRAIDDYKRALEIDPKCAEAYLSLCEAYVKIGDPRQAFGYLQKAASLDNETAKGLLKSRGTGW